MPDIDFTPLADGASVTAAALNGLFSTIRAGVNALPEYSIAPRALRAEHLPSLVDLLSSVNPAYTVALAPGALHTYTEGAPQLINSGGTNLQITWSTCTLGMANASRVAGILVLFNARLLECIDSPAGVDDATSLPNLQARFILQWRNAAGTWNNIARTERYVSNNEYANGGNSQTDVAIRTLLRESDLGGVGVQGVRALCAGYDGGAAYAAVACRLMECNLSIVPFHASDPS